MMVMVAYAGDTQCSQLPQFLVTYLCNGNIKLATDPGNHGFYNPSLLLKRLATMKMDFNPTNASVHLEDNSGTGLFIYALPTHLQVCP